MLIMSSSDLMGVDNDLFAAPRRTAGCNGHRRAETDTYEVYAVLCPAQVREVVT